MSLFVYEQGDEWRGEEVGEEDPLLLDSVSWREGEKSSLRPLISKCLLLRIATPSTFPNKQSQTCARTGRRAFTLLTRLSARSHCQLGLQLYLCTSCMMPTPHLSATFTNARNWWYKVYLFSPLLINTFIRRIWKWEKQLTLSHYLLRAIWTSWKVWVDSPTEL